MRKTSATMTVMLTVRVKTLKMVRCLITELA